MLFIGLLTPLFWPAFHRSCSHPNRNCFNFSLGSWRPPGGWGRKSVELFVIFPPCTSPLSINIIFVLLGVMMSVSNFAANQFGSCLQVGGWKMFIFLFVSKHVTMQRTLAALGRDCYPAFSCHKESRSGAFEDLLTLSWIRIEFKDWNGENELENT